MPKLPHMGGFADAAAGSAIAQCCYEKVPSRI
jgi:hypothetical protein